MFKVSSLELNLVPGNLDQGAINIFLSVSFVLTNVRVFIYCSSQGVHQNL